MRKWRKAPFQRAIRGRPSARLSRGLSLQGECTNFSLVMNALVSPSLLRLFDSKKGAVIYREGERVDAIFNIIGGVVTPYRTAPDGSEYIGAFLFADDLFGLSEEGRYTNSMRAITTVTAYRLHPSKMRASLTCAPETMWHT